MAEDLEITLDDSNEDIRKAYMDKSKRDVETTPPHAIVLPDSTWFFACYMFKALSYYIKQYHTSLLDVGCGRSGKANYWRSKGFTRVEGCDVSRHYAQEFAHSGLPFKIVDLNDNGLVLPYGHESFDIVVASHVLEHVKNPKKVVEEMVRVAKHRVIIVSPVGYSYYSGAHLHFWNTPQEIAKALMNKEYVFSIEFMISKPQDVEGINENNMLVIRQMGFIAVIYKQLEGVSPTFEEWMFGDEVMLEVRKARRYHHIYLSTEDNLFESTSNSV
jgi:2-polyprenyl-3-methyl-5-hydroxy-6-metoxy-1,4-benzoquinol methylase